MSSSNAKQTTDTGESVSEWIESMKQGDIAAYSQLWQRYYSQLITNARNMLTSRRTGKETFDEEDVLQSVFFALFKGIENGKFPNLVDRNGLWRLLIVMTERRTIGKIKHDNAQKRGGKVRIFPLYGKKTGSQLYFDIEGAPTPQPQTVEELVKTVDEMMAGCNKTEKRIVVERMIGHELNDIAARMEISTATIGRKLSYLKERLRYQLMDCQDRSPT